jgi:hypothetical protein
LEQDILVEPVKLVEPEALLAVEAVALEDIPVLAVPVVAMLVLAVLVAAATFLLAGHLHKVVLVVV